MPIDPDFLAILVCPMTHKPLRMATEEQLAKINHLIEAGEARTRGGAMVAEPLSEGLVPEGEAVVYPVRDEIPMLLIQEGILLHPAPTEEETQ